MAGEFTTYEEMGIRFSVEFHEVAHSIDPHNLAVMDALAHAYTASGQHHKGLELDRKLVRALPHDPTVRYNLACSLCLTGNIEESIKCLLVAIEGGYDDEAHLMADADLAAARAHPAFASVVAAFKESA